MKHEKNGLIDSDCFMSRRDQIAATALSGMLVGAITSGESWTADCVAQAAIESADALLERLDKHAIDQREKVAAWMIHNGYSTGHGDTIEELLEELKDQVKKSPHDEG